ncbi:MAG TPA: ion transporter [Bacteroidales bacterium]|nr:ion transporter [Bacteroidales bacterium]
MKTLKKLLLNDGFILVLIIINAIVLFLQGFDFPVHVLKVLSIIDNIITMIFVAELCVKLIQYGPANFFKSAWNIFDAVIILLAVPSLFEWFTGFGGRPTEYILVLRVLRVFKFFRFIRFLPDVHKVLTGFKRAMKTSMVIILGFFVYGFIVAVLSCYLYRNTAPEYFHTPLSSFYSIFKIFTIEGWYAIPDLIAGRTNEAAAVLTRIYFVFILVTGGIFGLSLVNSVFVDAMVSDNTDPLERKVDELEKKIDKLLEMQGKRKNEKN